MPKFLPYLALALLSLGTLEAVLRLMCISEGDGNYTFRSMQLKPLRIPVTRLEERIAKYTESDNSGPVYDSELGWALRPNAYHHNAAGFITSGEVPEKSRAQGKLRIALLGDSYTQGSFDSGWWRVLEQKLNAQGINAEVLNFGVSGYGMDQAYLRWHRDCAQWHPQIVIFGFMADICTRNLNLFRVLRDSSTGIPFMKPRFVLDGDGLKLVNSPTPSPAALKGFLRDITQWQGLAYEHFYNPQDYRMTPWRWTRLGAVLEAKLSEKSNDLHSEDFYKASNEGGQVALRIFRRLQKEVEASGAKFYVASLPCQSDLELLRNGQELPQEELNRAIKKEFDLIAMEPFLLEAGRGKDLGEFFSDSHYKGEFNQIVGENLATILATRQKGAHASAGERDPVKIGSR